MCFLFPMGAVGPFYGFITILVNFNCFFSFLLSAYISEDFYTSLSHRNTPKQYKHNFLFF